MGKGTAFRANPNKSEHLNPFMEGISTSPLAKVQVMVKEVI